MKENGIIDQIMNFKIIKDIFIDGLRIRRMIKIH